MFGFNEIYEEIKLIRESQIRMEEDIKYHIKRTDNLEEMVIPVHKFHNFLTIGVKIIGVLGVITGIVVGIIRVI